MTRKHYEAIAAVFAENRPSGYYLEEAPSDDQTAIWKNIVTDVAFILMDDNSRFDMERFKTACHK